jgi:hypothetical protein
LSDALVNRPPILEIIEESPAISEDNPFDAPLEPHAENGHESATLAPVFPVEPVGEQSTPLEANLLAGAAEIGDLDDASDFKTVAFEHDDLTVEEKDTEVEEPGYSISATEMREAPVDPEPIDVSPSGHGMDLDFGVPEAGAETVAFTGTSDEEEGVLDFGAPESPAQAPSAEGTHPDAPEHEIEIDFGDPDAGSETVAFTPDMQLDFGKPQHAAEGDTVDGEDAAIDFGEPAAAPTSGEDEELVPDFGDPVAAAPVAETPSEPADKKKKKKEKKAKRAPEPKSAADKPRKRSLVGTLAGVVLSSLVAVVIVLYGGIWLDPAYDFVGIAAYLPAWAKPAAAAKSKGPTLLASAPVNASQGTPGNPGPAVAESGPDNSVPGSPAADPATPNKSPTSEPSARDDLAPLPPSIAPNRPSGPSKSLTTPSPTPPATDSAAATPTVPEGADAGDNNRAADPELPSKALPDKAAADMPDEAAPPNDDAAAGDAASGLDSLLGDSKPATKPADQADQPAAEPEMPASPLDELAEELGPRNVPATAPADLAKAIQDATQANVKLTAAQAAKDDVELKRARKDFYLGLYDLANVAATVKEEGDGTKLEVQLRDLEELALHLAADPKRLDALKLNATRWLGFGKRTTPGIALAGTVREVDHVGKLYHVKLQLGSADAPTVTVVCMQDPDLNTDDEALTMGTIVEHPDEQLAGYEGGDDTVIWSGLTLKLPADGK